MARRYQYPSKIEPIRDLAEAEVVTIDKWYQRQERPAVKKFASAVFAASFFFVNAVTPAQAVPSDWQAQEQDVIRPIERARDFNAFFAPNFNDVVESSITIDRWFRPASTPVRPSTPRSLASFFAPDFNEVHEAQASGFGWKIQNADLFRRTPRTADFKALFFTNPSEIQEAIVDKLLWNVQEPDVIRRKPRTADFKAFFGPSFADLQEAVVDKLLWNVQEPDVVRKTKRTSDFRSYFAPDPSFPHEAEVSLFNFKPLIPSVTSVNDPV